MESTAIGILNITSTAFADKGMIPVKYTCDGENINPPLKIRNIPFDTESLVLIVEDPGAPVATWDHWIVWNIPPRKEIAENSIPGTEGRNAFLQHKYGGPCPPSGIHKYFFKVYALDTMLGFYQKPDKRTLKRAMAEHILAQGEIIGLYKRK